MNRFGDGPARPWATAVSALAVCLAATSVHAVITGWSWFWPAVLAVAVVAALGTACRWLRLPVAVQPVVSLGGLLVVLTGQFASGPAWGGVVPNGRSVHQLVTLLTDAVNSLDTLLAPVAPNPPFKFLAVGAIGVMAIAVDLIAVGGRRPSWAGVPLVLLVAVPSAIRERSVGFLPLLAAAVGFLLLLSLDGTDRTLRWGRVLPGRDDERTGAPSGTAGPALRIGAVALVAAVLVPLLVPGARTSRFASAGLGTGPGGSGGTVKVVDPFVSVQDQLNHQTDETLLTVATKQPTYQRITALEKFDDGGFSLGSSVSADENARVAGHQVSAPTAGVSVQAVNDQITASPSYAQNLLPVPEGPLRVDVGGDWRYAEQTSTIFSASTTTKGRSWTVSSAVPSPSAQQLAAAEPLGAPHTDFPDDLQIDLDTPTSLPAALTDTAQAWTRGATTAYQAALDIQRHFTDGTFRYDTSVAFDGGAEAFTAFLATKRGFCEQYSATMAAMLRSLGVPARVAIGFTPGTQEAPGVYRITGGDAHAWPEVWFRGIGWVRFEPTPLSGGRGQTPGYAQQRSTAPTAAPSTAPTTAPTAAPSADPSSPGAAGKNSKLENQDRGNAGGAGGSRGVPTGVSWALGVVGGLALLAVPAVLDRLTRRRRLRPGPPELAWQQLLNDAADRLVPVPASDSPRAAGGRLLAAVARAHMGSPEVTAAAGRVVAAVERSRYAPPGTGTRDADLRADVTTVVRALTTGLPAWPRFVALAFPPSARARLTAPIGAAGLLAARVVDRVAATVRRRPAAA